MKPLIYLASNSPRRFELLQLIGLNPQKIHISVDELVSPKEDGQVYVKRIARKKAEAALSQKRGLSLPRAPIVTADTVVCLNGQIMGKPKSVDDAKMMLEQLSGQTHQVYSSVCVLGQDQLLQRTNCSDVTFRVLSAHEIDVYVASGEPLDKAGAYAIQGLGALFVSEIRGDYYSIVGLSLFETMQLLGQLGVAIL